MSIATNDVTLDRDALQKMLRGYGMTGAGVSLLNVSENHTYLVNAGDSSAIMRLYRANRTETEIRSELAWMSALAEQTPVRVPLVLANQSGDVVHHLTTTTGSHKYAVLFEHLAGHEPVEDDLPRWFAILGELNARIHLHGQQWRRPANFDRPYLDWPALVGDRAIWGSWRLAPGLSVADQDILAGAAQRGHDHVEQFGVAPDRFGLIHGDLRPANLLVDGAKLYVIDFDDCASGWFLYDLATALSLLETLPNASHLIAAWLAGYTRVTALPPDHAAMIPHFIMLRRIQVLSWFASHPDTDLACTHGPPYGAATVAAARRYLSGGLPYGPD